MVQLQINDDEKTQQAISIVKETYLKDLKLKHKRLKSLGWNTKRYCIDDINTNKSNQIENTFKSIYHINITNDTIADYINWFEEAYLINKVQRYDVKGRKYIGSPYKIYFEDIGIRNAILNFREVDETDLIENIVYNELRYRGFAVDVGVVKIKVKTNSFDKNNKPIYAEKDTEVDFVARKGLKTYYIQVALQIDTPEKKIKNI